VYHYYGIILKTYSQTERKSRILSPKELSVELKLLNDEGKNNPKKETGTSFHSCISQNIPYGCLLTRYTSLIRPPGEASRFGKEVYKPYFNEEEIGLMDSSLLLEDLNRNKVSFVINGR